MNKFIRSAVTSEFTQIPNVIITDGRLTGSSLRLLLALYSLPRDWIVTLSGLAGRFGMTRSAVSAGMKKLKELGYVSISIERDGDGTFCYRYVLCDLEDKAEKLEKAASWEIRKSPKGKAKYQPVENSAEADNSIPDLPESVLTVSEKPVSVKIHTTNTVLTNTGHKNTVLTNIDRCPSDSDGDEESTKEFCDEETEDGRLFGTHSLHHSEFARDAAACGRGRRQASNVPRSEFEVANSNAQITGTANEQGGTKTKFWWKGSVSPSCTPIIRS